MCPDARRPNSITRLDVACLGVAVHLSRLRPELGQSDEEWAREQAAEGWQMWDAGHGAWVDINGRRVKRWSLRR
jgi:hypothetical protein